MHDFRKNQIIENKIVLLFYLQIWNISRSKKNSTIYYHKYT
jgi:hypothetical protein